jgi:hypothetical protein
LRSITLTSLCSSLLGLSVFSLSLLGLFTPHLLHAQPAQPAQPAQESTPQPLSSITLKTLWRFQGPLAPELRAIAQELYAERVRGHLFTQEALIEHLRGALSTANKGLFDEVSACLSGGSPCDDMALLLRRLRLKERVFVGATEGDQGFKVTLSSQIPGQPKRSLSAQGETLRGAARKLFEQRLQLGTLKLEGLPKEAEIKVGGEVISTLSEPLALPAGSYELSVSAPHMLPYSTQVEIKPLSLTTLTPALTPSTTDFKVIVLDHERMPDLKVTLNGQAVQVGALLKVKVNEPYEVVAEATDRVKHSESITFKPNTEVAVLTIEMPYSRPFWKVALKEPHPDHMHNALLYVRLSGGQLNAGNWGASVRGRDEVSALKSQAYSAGSWGVDAGLSWDNDPTSPTGSLRLDLGGFSYQELSDPITVGEGAPGASRCDGAPCAGYTLTSLQRYLTRLLWVGYQAPMWRVVPYGNIGLLWSYERGELAGGGEVSTHSLRLGWEVGLDATLTPEWGVKLSLTADAWPGERSAYQGALGLTYAFSVPYPF